LGCPAGELDAIAVVPFDGTAKNLTIFENYGHWGYGLHLLDPMKFLGMRGFRRRGFFAGGWGRCAEGGYARLLDVRKARTNMRRFTMTAPSELRSWSI